MNDVALYKAAQRASLKEGRGGRRKKEVLSRKRDGKMGRGGATDPFDLLPHLFFLGPSPLFVRGKDEISRKGEK